MLSVAPAALDELPTEALFRHTKRPNWGLGLCVDRTDAVWRLQFEDGKLRKLGVNYMHLCEVVTLPPAESERTVDELSAAAGVQVAREHAAAEGRALVTFDQQLALFAYLYPAGFGDAKWVKKMRGGKSRIKRHRDPVIAEAAEQLGEHTLKALVADGYDAEVVARLQALLQASSLVTKRQLQPLMALRTEHQQAFATSLAELLYGTGPSNARLHQYLAAFRPVGGASWPLATAILALCHPQHHACVSLSSMRMQARWMVPNLTIATRPSATLYMRLLSMVRGVREALVEEGLEPRDLFDVTDFIRETLRPAAVKLLPLLPKPEPRVRPELKTAASTRPVASPVAQEQPREAA